MKHKKEMIAKFDRRQKDYELAVSRLTAQQRAGYRRPGSRQLKKVGG